MMTNFLLGGVLLVASCIASAAQFESIIDALAIPQNAQYTNNDWESTQKIKGVKWRWPYYQSEAHDQSMWGKTKVGKDKNPNIGATTVQVGGARTMITAIAISINNEGIDLDAFGRGKVTKIRTSCDENGNLYSVEFYQFIKPGFKPLFISKVFSAGASGLSTEDYVVANEIDDTWYDINKQGCKRK